MNEQAQELYSAVPSTRIISNCFIDIKNLIFKKRLGDGQFVEVHHAQFITYTKMMDVAIKIIKSQCQSDEELGRMIKEAQLMKDFQHDNVLGLIGLSLYDDFTPMIVLPYMVNGSLLDHIRSQDVHLTKVQILKFAIDVANGKWTKILVRFQLL